MLLTQIIHYLLLLQTKQHVQHLKELHEWSRKQFSKVKLDIYFCFYCILPSHPRSSTIITKDENKYMQLYSLIDGTFTHSHICTSNYTKVKIHSPSTGHTTWRIDEKIEALMRLRIFAKWTKNWKRRLASPECRLKA